MTRAALFFLLLLLCAPGCDGTGGSEIGGSVAISYNVDFSRVDIKKQVKGDQFIAMVVEYVNDKIKGCDDPIDQCPRPVKVVANAPVTKGEKHDLVNDGTITRIMNDGSQFKDLREGFIRFDELGDVGKHAEGEFYGTFIDGMTINGKFSGTVQQLGE